MSVTSNTVQAKTTRTEDRGDAREYGRKLQKQSGVRHSRKWHRRAALAFAREGASVLIAERSEKSNQETACIIEQLRGRALAI